MSTREVRLQTIEGPADHAKDCRARMMSAIMNGGLNVQQENGLHLGKVIQVTLAPFDPRNANLGGSGEQVLETNGTLVTLTIELDDHIDPESFGEGEVLVAYVEPDTINNLEPQITCKLVGGLEGLAFRHD